MSIDKLARDVETLSKRPRVNFVFSASDIAGNITRRKRPGSSLRRTIRLMLDCLKTMILDE